MGCESCRSVVADDEDTEEDEEVEEVRAADELRDRLKRGETRKVCTVSS